MKGYNLWSYTPYRPLLTEVGDIYICRIVPGKTSIHFEWLDTDDDAYMVFYRKRGEKRFCLYQTVTATECDIVKLETETDYEFYVQSGAKKSRVRLARTGESIGVVVNYLHPDDEAYNFSGRYLCSPSFVRHPDGYLLASMDLFSHNKPQNLTLIFRSDDDGESWHYVNELFPCYWGQLFVHRGDIYMLSCSTEYGDLLISRSADGGFTFPAPVSILRGSNETWRGVHKSPQNMLYHNGRIYVSLEWGSWRNEEYHHAAMMMSCDENADLLVPENWSFTEPKKFTPSDAPELETMPECTITIEGSPVVSPDGKLLNFMRFGKPGYAIVYEANIKEPEEILKFSKCVKFDGHYSKFMIRYDEITKKYFTLANYIYDYEKILARNVLTLMVSDDLDNWEVVEHVIDMRDSPWEKVACQYAFFEFDKDDIIYYCRTAINNANSHHNSNYMTFHRLKNFRSLLK